MPVSINGSRGNATNFLLDNADNNDGYTNIAEPYPNPDAVQEFSIQTSYIRRAIWQRRRGCGECCDPSRNEPDPWHCVQLPAERQYERGEFLHRARCSKAKSVWCHIGGPVVIPGVYNGKDRTFFFGSYQGTQTSSCNAGPATNDSQRSHETRRLLGISWARRRWRHSRSAFAD